MMKIHALMTKYSELRIVKSTRKVIITMVAMIIIMMKMLRMIIVVLKKMSERQRIHKEKLQD